ncbi:MAG: peptidoglycan DD-metalloendopeptidase family protein [Caldilinea sp.]
MSDGVVVRRLWIAAAWIGLTVLLAPTAFAQTPAPVVSPTDITTPTPAPLALPTPTAAPMQPAQALDSPSAARATIHGVPDTSLTYTVQTGDTLFTVALEMGIDLDDVPCAIGPAFTVDQPLVISDVLSAHPANVLCHEVLPGETVESIAAAYFVDAEQIRTLPWNQLIGKSGMELTPRTHLRIPFSLSGAHAASSPSEGSFSDADFLALMLNMPVDTSPFVVFAQKSVARKPVNNAVGPVPADWPYGSGRFAWPVYGWLSQGYRYDHRAIDVAAPQGTPVTAADRGVVLRAGWNNQGYGRFVIIDHKIDYVTLYAHLDRVLVQEGEVVGQGQVIGTVGSTGNSTGAHLHFEIRDFGRLSNPLELLVAP